MNYKKKIIVLTPVKNEAWILERFLKVTSIYADHILIADQNSTDGSLDLYKYFPKVNLIKNESFEFNEDERQILLLKKAREFYGTGNILLAIDADEILAANAMQSEDWLRMHQAEPGTIINFEKPSLYKDKDTVIRFLQGGWPLGYVDDGADHKPSKIHSSRIPTPANSKTLYLDGVKFLHFNSVRLKVFDAKQRYYCMLENINNSRSLRKRLRMYDQNLDILAIGDTVEKSKEEWFKGWSNLGINFNKFEENPPFWYQIESLRLFKYYGLERFKYDDIWYFDWEKLRIDLLRNDEKDIPEFKIIRPNPVQSFIVQKSLKSLNRLWSAFKN